MTDGVPSLCYEFVPVGTVLKPAPGRVAVDVGNKCVPGVIDHHFAGAGAECAATLIAARPQELVLDHLGEDTGGEVPVLVHKRPDMDCLVSAYLVRELLRSGELQPSHQTLAEYARVIDSGRPPPDGLGRGSLLCVYKAMCHLEKQRRPQPEDPEDLWRTWIRRGFDLLDLAVAAVPDPTSQVCLPDDLSGWEDEQRLVDKQLSRYQGSLRRARTYEIELPCPTGGTRTVQGMSIVNPRCLLFKAFARAEGYTFLQITYHRKGQPRYKASHEISVAPDRGVWLRGLGWELEAREVLRRAERGHEEQGLPRWPDVIREDPWYDGRSSLHDYTIVDRPTHGTLLSWEEISQVVQDTEKWINRGKIQGEKVCPQMHVYPAEDDSACCRWCPSRLYPRVVDGRFKVVDRLGEGGMGVVFEVEDLELGDPCALKLVLNVKDHIGSKWQRFVRESTMMQRVEHPGVVRMLAFGADPFAGPYMATELVNGCTLDDELNSWYKERGEFYPWPRICSTMLQACEALQAIHDAGVLHRDLKPGNIMLEGVSAEESTTGQQVKLIDFGIAILADPDKTRLTSEGAQAGTRAYIPPELLDGKEPTTQSDLYALGAIFFEMLSGAYPFADCPDWVSLATVKCTQPSPPLHPLHPALSADTALKERVEQLLARLLERDPDRRPESAAAIAAELRAMPGFQAN